MNFFEHSRSIRMAFIFRCIANCMIGDDKITSLNLKGRLKEHDHRQTSGLACSASAFFAQAVIVLTVIIMCMASTTTSTIPSKFTSMTQYVAYNLKDDAGETGSDVLNRFSANNDAQMTAATLITILCAISWFASARPVSRLCQYFTDVLCVGFSCFTSAYIFLRNGVEVPQFHKYCVNAIPGVIDNPSMNPGNPGYDQYCLGLVQRAWILFLLFGLVTIITGLAFISNWCGLICCACFDRKKTKK